MYTFLLSVCILIIGYYVYGKFVETVFGIDPAAKTPALTMNDGMDYIPFSWKKSFLIQFLNIAGTGPIFGAILGALWGPVAFLWIVFGCIFAGAVHDFLIGMISLRNNGITIAEIVGKYLGTSAKVFMRLFSIVLLLLVGVVFIISPADILGTMLGIDKMYFVYIITIYYILATLLPIDKLIGRIYPIFGVVLLVMAVSIGIAILFHEQDMPELTFQNLHPRNIPIFPFLFITIACGAISGFHATQSPLVARCLYSEKDARKVFYGAMIAEGIVALIWAAAAMTFFGGTLGLASAGTPGVVVNTISSSLLGHVGSILAILGVVACPITSGDTAFRSARLIIADAFNLKQKSIPNRLIVSIPLFVIGIFLCFIDFNIIWRYFSWSNQTLATIALWAAAAYLVKKQRNYWIALIPALFMTVVVTSYILCAPEGFAFSITASTLGGIIVMLLVSFIFFRKFVMKEQE